MERGERKRGGMTAKSTRSFHHFISPLLRILQLFASAVAFSVMFASGTLGLAYSSFQAFRYLVAATIITAFFALVMFVVDLLMLCLGRKANSPTLIIIRTILDFIASCLALSAGAAAAGITTFNDHGTFPYQQTVCQGDTPWSSFCARSKTATAMAFIAFFFLLPSVLLDVFTMATAYEEVMEE